MELYLKSNLVGYILEVFCWYVYR